MNSPERALAAMVATPMKHTALRRVLQLGGREATRTGRRRNAGVSYAQFLVPEAGTEKERGGDSVPMQLAVRPFNPSSPPFGFHAQSLGAWLSLSWERRADKEECNGIFARAHPWIDSSVTLSKLRNLKLDIFGLMEKAPYLDVSVVACAWVYFERLVVKGVVHKSTRKILAGVCLMLAFKLYQAVDVKGITELAHCIQELDSSDYLRAEDLIRAEFHVFALLEFSLKLQFDHILPHLLQHLHFVGVASRARIWKRALSVSRGLDTNEGEAFMEAMQATKDWGPPARV